LLDINQGLNKSRIGEIQYGFYCVCTQVSKVDNIWGNKGGYRADT